MVRIFNLIDKQDWYLTYISWNIVELGQDKSFNLFNKYLLCVSI